MKISRRLTGLAFLATCLAQPGAVAAENGKFLCHMNEAAKPFYMFQVSYHSGPGYAEAVSMTVERYRSSSPQHLRNTIWETPFLYSQHGVVSNDRFEFQWGAGSQLTTFAVKRVTDSYGRFVGQIQFGKGLGPTAYPGATIQITCQHNSL